MICILRFFIYLCFFLEIATWRKTKGGMGRRMLMNHDPRFFLSLRKSGRHDDLSWLCKTSSAAARRCFLITAGSLSLRARQQCLSELLVNFLEARDCRFAVNSIQKPTPPGKCLTSPTWLTANWKLAYQANKQGCNLIFLFLHVMVLKWGSMSLQVLSLKGLWRVSSADE